MWVDSGPASGLSPSLGNSIAKLQEVQSVAPVRLGEFGINNGRSFLNATDLLDRYRELAEKVTV